MNSEQPNQYREQSIPKGNPVKSVFESKTFWGIIFTAVAAIAPIVGKDVDKSINQQPVDYGQDIAQVVVIICGTAASVCGRVEAKDFIYTPTWLPGPNKTDVEKK